VEVAEFSGERSAVLCANDPLDKLCLPLNLQPAPYFWNFTTRLAVVFSLFLDYFPNFRMAVCTRVC